MGSERFAGIMVKVLSIGKSCLIARAWAAARGGLCLSGARPLLPRELTLGRMTLQVSCDTRQGRLPCYYPRHAS